MGRVVKVCVLVALVGGVLTACARPSRLSVTSPARTTAQRWAVHQARSTSPNLPQLLVCRAEHMRLAVKASGSTMSQPFADIAVTNTGTTSCTLRGYPHIAVWGHRGWQFSSYPTVRRGIVTHHGLYERIDPGPRRVVLRPHRNAYFSIGTATAFQGGLYMITLTRLAVTLPDVPVIKALPISLDATRPPGRAIPIGITAVTPSPHP